MKIRRGFVSNSSSTSFAVMTTKENYERALEKAHPHVAAYIKHSKWAWSEDIFQGQDVMVLCQEVSSEDPCEPEYMGYTGETMDSQHFNDGTPAYPGELINEFIMELEKNPNEVACGGGGH